MVLQRLLDAGLRAHPVKTRFFDAKTEYCGHAVSADGLHKLPAKVDAIRDAPQPTNVSQLRSFSWSGELLCSILAESVDNAASAQPIAAAQHLLALDWCLHCCFRRSETSNRIWLGVDAFPPGSTASCGKWCLARRPWHCSFSLHAWRNRAAHRLCFSHAEHRRAELQPDWQGSPWYCVEPQKVSYISVRSTLHAHHRSSAADSDLQPSQKSAVHDSRSPAAVCSPSRRIPVWHGLPENKWPWQCQQTVSPAHQQSCHRSRRGRWRCWNVSRVTVWSIACDRRASPSRNSLWPDLGCSVSSCPDRRLQRLHWPPAVLPSTLRAHFTSRMSSVGCTRHHSTLLATECLGRASQFALRYRAHEGTRSQLCVVAEDWPRHRVLCLLVQQLPSAPSPDTGEYSLEESTKSQDEQESISESAVEECCTERWYPLRDRKPVVRMNLWHSCFLP